MKYKVGCLEISYRMAGEVSHITLPYLELDDGYHEHELMIPHGGAQNARICRSQDRDGGSAVRGRTVVKTPLSARIGRSEGARTVDGLSYRACNTPLG
jgi:hypothetical protein